MKKILSKLIAALIVLSMAMSLLPTQFVLAAKDVAQYSTYGDSIETMKSSNYQGTVFELKEEAGTYYDHLLTVSAYNMEAATQYQFELLFDADVVNLKRTGRNNNYTGTNVSQFYTLGTVTESMNSEDQWFVDEDISKTLYTTDISVIQVASDSNIYDPNHNYYKIEANFILNMTELNLEDWTNDQTGSKLDYVEGGYNNSLGYKYPDNELCEFLSMQFEVIDEVNNPITSDTFKIYDNEIYGFCGARGGTIHPNPDTTSTHTVLTYTHNEGVYFIGFVEPEVSPVDVTFSVVDSSDTSTAISGATVALFTDSNCTTPATSSDGTALSGQTDSTGDVTIQNVPANKSYYYKVTASNYDEATGGPISVSSSNLTVSDAVKLTKETEKTYALTVTVKNADDGSILSGAEVFIQNASAGTTDQSGQLTANRTKGTYNVKASMTGYQTSAEQSAVVSESGGSAEIKLVPNRIKLKLPEIHDADGSISGAQYTLVKTSTNRTDAWTSSGAYNAGAEIELPANSKFTLTTSVAGYSSQTLYVETDATGATIYTDSNQTQFTDENVTVSQLGDPYYRVEFTNDGAGTYTATVYLKNIEAVNGTFGMRYDKDVFTFQSCNLNDALEFPEDSTGANPFPAVTQNDSSDQIGYHVFSWIVKDTSTTFDARNAELPVAMYTFALNTGKTEDDIDTDAFSVMPYDKTAAARDYIAQCGVRDDVTNEYLDMLWRYTDEENDPNNLGEARLAEEFATDRGFYQVFSYDDAIMADVMTIFEGITAESAALVFEAEDDKGNAVKDVEITLCDSNENVIKTLKTDASGIASTSVDISNGPVTYKYKASCYGYWDIEMSENTSVTISEMTTKYVYLNMKEKIYHNVKLQDGNGNDITDAELTGDEYAYNEKDFHFNIIAKIGKVFDITNANVVAEIEGTDYPVTFSAKDNMFVIPGNIITGEKNGPADINGFPSDDIIIKIAAGSITDSTDTYTVTALAGTGGKVAYADPSDSNAAIDPNGKKIVVSNISPGGSTLNFTFTADSGKMVERVVINGVEYDVFDNKLTFSYNFTNITEDCSIAVTFWDDETPSDDSIVTLVVGEHGSVDVTAPQAEAETGITKERRAYIFTSSGDLTFTETPDSGYELNAVEQEVNGGTKQTLSPDSGTTTTYSAHIGSKENVVVYVTFKAPGEGDTFNVFVKSYVAKGEGTIIPMGIMIHTKRERPLFEMKTLDDPDWKLTSVLIDGIKQRYIEQSKDDEQHDYGTYRFAPLTEDTSIGAVFTETAYCVHGIVDLSNGFSPLVTTNNALSGATLKFTRDDGAEVIAYSGNDRTGATFEANLAQGNWKVEVSKKGYLRYIITDFEVQTADIAFGAAAGSSDPRPIVLTIGDTSGKGNVVSFEDAGVVAGSMRIGASQKLTDKGNVDDSDDNVIHVDTDMVYVMTNYGKRYTQKTYADFVAGK